MSDTNKPAKHTATLEALKTASTGEVVICTNPRYSPTWDTFDDVEEFQRMVKACFGAEEVLTHQPLNGQWVDETGERVLVSASRALREAVGDGLLETTFGDLGDLEEIVEAGDGDPVLLEPGWYATDGNSSSDVQFPGAEDGAEAADLYVDGGWWGEPDETIWVTIYTYRRGWVIDRSDGKVALTIGRESRKVAVEPDEPKCEDGHEHSWTAPWSVVGGDKGNPGVRGNGGGLIYREVCAHCGAYRVTNTWAQDKTDGEQGLTSRRYERGDSDSFGWLCARRRATDLETLKDTVPPGSYDETTFGDLDEVHESVNVRPADPALVEEGWYAECDDAEVAYSWAMSAIEAAVQYVEDGDWGEPGVGDPWVDVYTYRRGWVIDIDTREVTAITIDRDRKRIGLHLEE